MKTVTQIQKQIENQLTKIKETYNTFLVTDNYNPYKVQKELHSLNLLCDEQEQYLIPIIFKDVKGVLHTTGGKIDIERQECDGGNNVQNPFLNIEQLKKGSA